MKRLAASDVCLLEATGADVLLHGFAVNNNGNALNVGAELTGNRAVGVADGTASNGVLSAEIANFRHDTYLQRDTEVPVFFKLA